MRRYDREVKTLRFIILVLILIFLIFHALCFLIMCVNTVDVVKSFDKIPFYILLVSDEFGLEWFKFRNIFFL